MTTYTYTWTPGPSSWNFGAAADPLQKGLAAHRQGNLREAWTNYLQALRARPQRALAAYLLGLLQIDRGMGLSSLPFLIRAHLLQPLEYRYLAALLFAQLRAGRFNAFMALLNESQERHLELDYSSWRHWSERLMAGEEPSSLGLPAPSLNQVEAAEEPLDSAQFLNTESSPHSGLADPFALAIADYHAGRLEELIARLVPLIDLHPSWGEGHHLFGLGMSLLGRLDKAEPALLRAAALLPGREEIWDHLAILLTRLGRYDEAMNAFDQSLALNPLRPESWNNAADSANTLGIYDGGYQYALLALQIDPSLPAPLYNMGSAAIGMGKLDLATGIFTEMLENLPNHVPARQKLGEICLIRGDHQQAQAHYQLAIAADPDNLTSLTGFLFVNHYLASEPPDVLLERARHFGALLSRNAEVRTSWPKALSNQSKLRIGFVSGDFCNHPVGYFFATLAEALCRSPTLELFAYPTSPRNDALTARIRGCFLHWTPILGLDDLEASERIAADGIHLLVDLSGHTAGQRLGVFARKPAPIQVSWLGYFATTGVAQIDYLLVGPWDVPPAEEGNFVERIWRLPHTRLCFSKPDSALEVAPSPLTSGQPFTFGCFNTIKKINDPVLRLWARILLAAPASRLYLKARELEAEQARQAILDRFARLGVNPQRLLVEGPSPMEDYLAAYHRVDIALDPFPYTGGTTSIQALWMGVPILTMAGSNLLARQGESMLRALEMPGWVASSEADYLAKALSLMAKPGDLATIRWGLRQKLLDSPLMNAGLFAAELERAFATIWSSRGANQSHGCTL